MKIFLIIVGVLVVLIALLMSLSATLTLIYDGGWHTSVQVLFIKKDIVLSQILSFILFPEKSAEQTKKKGKEKKENKKDTTEPTPENAPTEDEKATQAVPEQSESEKAPAKAEEKVQKAQLLPAALGQGRRDRLLAVDQQFSGNCVFCGNNFI